MPSERNLLRETSKPRCINCNEIGRQQRLRERPRATDFSASFESGHDFLQCSVCKCHLCDICVGNLLVVIGEKNNDDEWYQNAKEWFENQSLPSPPGFIGHCCELKTMARDNKPFNGLGKTKYDGCLFFPQVGLLIGDDATAIDIHAVGGSQESPPYWHCLVSPFAGNEYYKKNIQAKPLDVSRIPLVSQEIDLKEGIKKKVSLLFVCSTTKRNES